MTTISTEYFKRALRLLDELGWDQLDICVVPSDDDRADYPLLMIRPPSESFFGGENAGIAIAPLTEKGRDDGGEES